MFVHLLSGAFVLGVLSAPVHPAEPPGQDIMELSLAELMTLQVTSVSKRPENLFGAPAAVYVLTGDEIRRSGARTLPDALRLVPGVNVAQINASRYALTIRGFQNQYANKLLVLIDGRSVYTPMFSGVYWELQDYLLEDLDRIEVIRGPGAALWGANAVNGVINILTKSAADTAGAYLNLGGGVGERRLAEFRYGEAPVDGVSYRVWAKYRDHDDLTALGGGAGQDEWTARRAGFRADWSPSHRDSVTVTGEVHDGDYGELITRPVLGPPYGLTQPQVVTASGRSLVTKWHRALEAEAALDVQTYYDHTDILEGGFREVRRTVDVELQHRLAPKAGHELTWGAGYRQTSDRVTNSAELSFARTQRTDDVLSAFLQDRLTLREDELFLTLGAKFENNDYTGSEFQPSARLLWRPHQREAYWASLSRAVRTPSRFESDARLNTFAFPDPQSGMPIQATLVGNPNMRAEELLALEVGYRVEPYDRLSVEATAFFNDYDRLRSLEPGAPFPGTGAPPHLVLPSVIGNGLQGKAYGLELTSNWQARSNWRLLGSYAYLGLDLQTRPGSLDTRSLAAEESSPRHQFTVRSLFDLSPELQLDTTLQYVGSIQSGQVPSYTRADVRLGWRPDESTDLSLVVQNLFNERQPETALFDTSTSAGQRERSVYAQYTRRF